MPKCMSCHKFIVVISKTTFCSLLSFLHNLLVQWYQQCVTAQYVPMCMSRLKAIEIISKGARFLISFKYYVHLVPSTLGQERACWRMMEKLNLFHLTGLTTMMLLMRKWMGLLLNKNIFWIAWVVFLLNYIEAVTLPL